MKKLFSVRISIILLLLTAAVLASCAAPKPAAPEERITAVFSALGVTDAQFREQVSDPGRKRDGCLLYTSDAAKMGYFFDPDTGAPVSLLRFDLLDSPYREDDPAAREPMLLPGESRDEALLRYAQALLGGDMIGQLSVRVGQDEGAVRNYTVTETYDGIPTGTSVGFTSRSNGSVSTVRVELGSIFKPGFFGRWVIAAGDQLIGEEAAIAVAREGFAQLDMGKQSVSDDISCELTASQDALLYTVQIHFTDGNGWVRGYKAVIDAHTGELLKNLISK